MKQKQTKAQDESDIAARLAAGRGTRDADATAADEHADEPAEEMATTPPREESREGHPPDAHRPRRQTM